MIDRLRNLKTKHLPICANIWGTEANFKEDGMARE
jgi:hypothetical protein